MGIIKERERSSTEHTHCSHTVQLIKRRGKKAMQNFGEDCQGVKLAGYLCPIEHLVCSAQKSLKH